MVYVILEGALADRRAVVGDSLDVLAGLLRPLPKVELHAHLSGCLRLSTIVDFSKDAGVRFSRAAERDLAGAVVLRRPARSYGWSFSPWKRVIDKVTSVPANHYRMTYEVAQDMAADGVVYA
jgi:adenosine deaminase